MVSVHISEESPTFLWHLCLLPELTAPCVGWGFLRRWRHQPCMRIISAGDRCPCLGVCALKDVGTASKLCRWLRKQTPSAENHQDQKSPGVPMLCRWLSGEVNTSVWKLKEIWSWEQVSFPCYIYTRLDINIDFSYTVMCGMTVKI